ncbi:MAG TPA: hypothetical protein VFR67_24100 [Pilimelia sp.]|nr:hypothetical protein [Pilimelia sp.]
MAAEPEARTAAAGWALRYELAPEGAQGQYGGAYQLGGLLSATIGPTLVAVLTDRYEAIGWLALAAIFLAGLVVGGPAIRWARSTRPRYLVDLEASR